MKVGFIDHHLNNYHANKFHSLLTGPVGKGEIEIIAAWESNPEGAEDWCKVHNVYKAASPSEVVAKSDAVIVLAPDNVDTHLELAKPALDSGKPVLVDKVLSSSLEDAKKIVDMAATHKTPVMSASALWFSVELLDLLSHTTGEIKSIFSRGFGRWRGYAVHTVSPALRLMNRRVKRVIDTGEGNTHIITLDDGSRRTLIDIRESENQMDATPWQVGVLVGDKYEVITVKKFDEFYANLMTQAVEFFKTGKSPLTVEQMLDVVAVEVFADKSRQGGGIWVDVTI